MLAVVEKVDLGLGLNIGGLLPAKKWHKDGEFGLSLCGFTSLFIKKNRPGLSFG